MLSATVPPHNATLMGMIHGVGEAFGLTHSDAFLAGGSGYAFVTHVHEALCPSGPYCWNRGPVFGQLARLGIGVEALGFFSSSATPDERAAVEARLDAELAAGRPAGLVNMEFQLISSADESGFTTSQPWPGMDFPPANLTRGTWAEFGHEVHVDFFAFHPTAVAPKEEVIETALGLAIDFWDHPERTEGQGYGMGPRAYALWDAALEGHGMSHGNWWNATVWAEGKAFAAEFLREVGRDGSAYDRAAEALKKVADREASISAKREALQEAGRAEREGIEQLRTH